jgi:NitT/TauT family transport system ATP-binding protein
VSYLMIDHVHHTYFTKTSANTALSDVLIEIEEGEFVSFLGPSGCGKTTLLSIIAGLITPTEGMVYLESNPIQQTSKQMGYMLQQDYLFPWKTIEDNILLGLKISKRFNSTTKAYSLELLDKMGLSHVAKQYPKQLSGGMRQRIALVRTLVTEPKILLLDEPFSALDYQTKLKLEDLVSNTLKSFGKTAILVTHDIGEAIAMSDRVFVFAANPGRVHKVFTMPEELKKITPFEARNHQEFPKIFQTVWKELESLGSKD